MDINKEKERLVVFSDILFQYIYFFLKSMQKKVLLVIVFHRNSVLMVVRQILFYSS